MKILVVEDDQKLARFLSKVLVEEGHVVDTCDHGDEALQSWSGNYDLMVLDWMLPGMDGVSVCREVRRRGSQAPILMLTARGELSERVLGLDAGADDYLVKPFEVAELVARVHALLRRSSAHAELKLGPLLIDRHARRVFLLGEAVALTAREFSLLLHLAQKAESFVSRTELLAQVWSTTFDPGSNVVEVHICRLRDKLGAHGWMVDTQRGRGYRLRTSQA